MAQGITRILGEAEGFEVVGWVPSGEEAITVLESLAPDVVLVDTELTTLTGLELSRWIKERYPKTKIVFLSTHINKQLLAAGIQCGISGYLHKDIDGATLCEAISSVDVGGHVFAEPLMKLVFDEYCERQKLKKPPPSHRPDRLTNREYEVLQLLAQGKTNREVGEALFISIKTVETHKSNILDKLGLKNIAELTKYAIKNNIITP